MISTSPTLLEPDSEEFELTRSNLPEIVKRSHAPLVEYACRFTQDTHLAEDVVQELWIKALTSSGAFRRKGINRHTLRSQAFFSSELIMDKRCRRLSLLRKSAALISNKNASKLDPFRLAVEAEERDQAEDEDMVPESTREKMFHKLTQLLAPPSLKWHLVL